MASTFARLCQQVDLTQRELEGDISRLTTKVQQLESVQGHSKTLRSVPTAFSRPTWATHQPLCSRTQEPNIDFIR